MKSQTESDGQAGSVKRDQIARKAYELWQTEGCPHGRAAEHWRKAEQLLASGLAGPTSAPVNQPSGQFLSNSTRTESGTPARGKSFSRASR